MLGEQLKWAYFLKAIVLTVLGVKHLMSLVLLLEPFNLSKNLLNHWPLWLLHCSFLISGVYFQLVEGNQWSKTFWQEEIQVLNNWPHRNKTYQKSTSKSLPRSEEIPIFVSSCIFNTSCQISINALYQSLHVNFIIICPGCANGTTTQRFPDSLQWPVAGLSWAQTAQCTGFSYVMVHSNYKWWIPPVQWQAICFPLTKHREKNLCDVGRILEHDGYKSMLCQEKTVKLIPKGVV